MGDIVTWRNNDDNEQHSVTSMDVINSAKAPVGVNHVLTGTGNPFTLTFNEPGQWLYYCRFHAALEAFNQHYRLEEPAAAATTVIPKATGPIPPQQEAEVLVPMMGVITILPRKKVNSKH